MEDRIILAHGSGGKLSHDLIKDLLLRELGNPCLNLLDDAATLTLNGRLAFTTDSYVVSPLFFPGGDIGKLAVCGTVNDLSMVGAIPKYVSLSLIIEEGFLLKELKKIISSIHTTAQKAGVEVVTGDTKVVNRGSADKLFINTAGIGIIPDGVELSGSNAKIGDKIILSGPLGDHGIAILCQREGLKFKTSLESDCAPLNTLVADMLEASKEIHVLRDPTRGGLASTLNEFAESSKVGIKIAEDKIPVRDAVRAACELLGFDPLYVANEGKLVAVVCSQAAEKVLSKMQKNEQATQAAIIGEIVADHPGKVVMKTQFGSSRIISMLAGELLPRIC
ncbi:MAG: hydrogenase expression/formation protein HypE [Thermodesulfobacteriota bacterium]|jgi:hydrogenase expression/formation protein HypE|nr:MAG: hydrogenase expression/formation protein HypE [Thermodesulfobacteriota bacterium]